MPLAPSERGLESGCRAQWQMKLFCLPPSLLQSNVVLLLHLLLVLVGFFFCVTEPDGIFCDSCIENVDLTVANNV